MVYTKELYIRWAIICAVAGLVMSMSFFNSKPALAQESVALNFILTVPTQPVVVYDATGNSVGGYFRADVLSDRYGQVTGNAELIMPDVTHEVEFTEEGEIIYDPHNNPVAVVLRGQGRTSGDSQTLIDFVKWTATLVCIDTAVPECLILDLPGSPGLPDLYFEVEGSLQFREQ
jgi:hypothetical protein